MAVNISFKQAEPVAIELDMSKLAFGQALEMMKLQSAGDEESINELVAIVSELASTDIRKMAILDAQEVIQAVLAAIQGDIDAEKN